MGAKPSRTEAQKLFKDRRDYFYPNYPRIPFRNVPEGRGGTLHFRDLGPPQLTKSVDDHKLESGRQSSNISNRSRLTRSVNDPNPASLQPKVVIQSQIDHRTNQYVGTYGVRTCVGVYFAIDDQRCFLAHINAFQPYNDSREVSEFDGNFIRDKTFNKLYEHAEANSWDPRAANSRILQSLLMVCAEPDRQVSTHEGPIPLTGWWVMEGIKRFLKAPSDTPFERKEGFVVAHRDGTKDLLSFEDPGKWERAAKTNEQLLDPPELYKYKPIEEPGLASWKVAACSYRHILQM